MKGSISEEALAEYSRLAAEKLDLDFSEGEVYDFARCMRADGSFYGTSGKCRKGSEAGEKEKEEKQSSGKKPRATANELRDKQRALFDDAKAKRAAAKEAEKAAKVVAKETKGDKSPEARKRRLEAGRAWDKANTAADRAQTAWMKAHEKWSKAGEREKRAQMSPGQRKEARRIDKIIKERG
jgi:hypothetical protein